MTALPVLADHVRENRLRLREGEHFREDWEARWASAEEYYFTNVMPSSAFDLVLDW